jgi:hypothetical protein
MCVDPLPEAFTQRVAASDITEKQSFNGTHPVVSTGLPAVVRVLVYRHPHKRVTVSRTEQRWMPVGSD